MSFIKKERKLSEYYDEVFLKFINQRVHVLRVYQLQCRFILIKMIKGRLFYEFTDKIEVLSEMIFILYSIRCIKFLSIIQMTPK